MKSTSLTVIRHGESTLNGVRATSPAFFSDSSTRDLFKNTPDHRVPLTVHGMAQAAQTGQFLSGDGVNYDIAVHTGYTRTKQTLDQILQSIKASGTLEISAFRERENGYAYTMTKSEVANHFPWNEQYWKTFGPIFARPIGGENLMDVCNRIRPALDTLISSHKGKNILLVTHGRIITMIRFILEQWTLEELESFLGDPSQSPVNCGVTTYSFDAVLKPYLLSYNEKYW